VTENKRVVVNRYDREWKLHVHSYTLAARQHTME